jgi:hypothetical protein
MDATQQVYRPTSFPLHATVGTDCWTRCGLGAGGSSSNSVGAGAAVGGAGRETTANVNNNNILRHLVKNNNNMTNHRHHHQNNIGNNKNSNGFDITQQADIDKMIANELHAMTLQEREEVFHDIHGVAETKQESLELITRCQVELEDELSLIGPTSEAYTRAWNDSPEYVRSLYLMFLRGNQYDASKASRMMVEHFDVKLKLWGIDKLARNITQADMDKGDLAFLKEGCFHTLGQRDQAGRPIFCKLWYHQHFKTRENVWRCLWYTKMVVAADEESQLKGQCAIIYNVNDHWLDTFDPVLFKGVSAVRDVMPVKDVAVHYCYSDPKFGAAISFVTSLFDPATKARTRLHHGSHVEVQYELQSYGIPIKALPMNSDGIVRRKELINFLDRLRAQEEQFGHTIYSNYPGQSTIIIPSLYDILAGRGKPTQTHPGNLRLGFLVEERIHDYVDGSRKDKIAISNNIYDALTQDSCRFLKQDKNGINSKMDREEAVRKIEHFFRNRKQSLAKTPGAAGTATSAAAPPVKRPTESLPVLSSMTNPSPVTVSDMSEDEESTTKIGGNSCNHLSPMKFHDKVNHVSQVATNKRHRVV